jgi:hypothetical protein
MNAILDEIQKSFIGSPLGLFLLVGLRDRRCWNSRFQKKEKKLGNWNLFIYFFFPANPVHESTTFIALALFMKSYRFDKNIFLQIYFGIIFLQIYFGMLLF